MNFKLKKSEYYPYNITELIHDYQNMDLSVQEIREKHNIGSGAWQTVLKRLKEHGVTMRGYSKTQPVRKAKHYWFDKHSQSWRVYKFINGKQVGFGGYRTEKEAQARVKELKKNNWDGYLCNSE